MSTTKSNHNPPARNGQTLNIDNRITVKTTVDTKAKILGVIIPKGTIGKVLEFHYRRNGENNFLIIDFGLLPVFTLPADSHLIEIMGVSDD